MKLFELFTLLEATKYDGMFSNELKRILEQYGINIDFKSNIQWAKKHLKRNDRVVWYLRQEKISKLLGLYAELNRNHSLDIDSPEALEAMQFVEKEIKKYNSKSNDEQITLPRHPPDMYRVSQSLDHLLSINYQPIRDYVFGWQSPAKLANELGHLEDEWSENKSRFIDDADSEKVFLDAGDGYIWFDLQREYCDAEAEAMGHCGNAPVEGDENQNLLSLRKKMTDTNGNMNWKVLLTFIYHKKEKSLGEMKGYKNQKPSEKYHPYIVKLLWDDRIQRTHGGGYAAESNFSLMDLPENVRNELIDKKPRLLPINEQVKLNGITPEIVEDLNEVDSKIEFYGEEQRYYYVYEKLQELKEVIEYYGSDSAKYAMGIISGDYYFEFDSSINKEAIEYYLTGNQIDALDKYASEHPEAYEENDEDWYETLDSFDNEFFEGIERAYQDAEQLGIESAMAAAIQDADIDDHPLELQASSDHWYDSTYRLVLDQSTLADIIVSSGSGDPVEIMEYVDSVITEDKIEVSINVPYDGFFGFAEEHFTEAVEEILKEHT